MKKVLFTILACSLFLNTAYAQAPASVSCVVDAAQVESLSAQIDRIRYEIVMRDEAQKVAFAEHAALLKRHDEQPMWITRVITSPTFLAIIGGLAAGHFAIPAAK
jgi:hypothetical protein